MCRRCDELTPADIRRQEDQKIRDYGYYLEQVVSPNESTWSYTVGLTEAWDQAELICFDIEPDSQFGLIGALADEIVEAGTIHPDSLAILDVELVPVHNAHLTTDLVAAWQTRYEMLPNAGGLLQVVPGKSWFCKCHAAMVSRYDTAHGVAPNSGLNRAERRARRRWKTG